jgi:defect in organelle trafficking protein DotD
MSTKHLIIIGIALLVVGCTRHVVPIQSPYAITTLPYQTNADDAEIKLAEAAVSVSKSLNNLAEIERATHPCLKLPPPINAECFGLACLASVDWIGPIEPLLRRIADVTHYRLRVLGRAPAIPVVVSITEKNVSFADILRNISLQAHKKACIVLYPRSRVIELRYLT